MSVLVNDVRRTFYMDSVALMRLSRAVSALPGVERAALMIGSTTNQALMSDAGLLDDTGRGAGANDLILAVRAADAKAASAALEEAQVLLDQPRSGGAAAGEWHPKTLDTALQQLAGANLALISVPGEFAAAEARRALGKGLHVMMFSDNLPIEDEIALKEDAVRRGLLMMGPDCGTAIIGGAPLAFANVVPRGDIGVVAASGTGLQEVATLLARNERGISHAIGVGGRDLKGPVGGLMTLAAIDALDRDPDTRQIVVISKPPEAAVAERVLERAGRSAKPFTICFLGVDEMAVPGNVRLNSELRSTAEDALGGRTIDWADRPAPPTNGHAGRIVGLYTGGTLCAEAQVFFRRKGVEVTSNVPISGVGHADTSRTTGHVLLDLGDDEYTVGRPHPMIDPSLRNAMLRDAIADAGTSVVLLDVVIGYGAHADPAGELVAELPPSGSRNMILVASVCGTEEDPQIYSRQVKILRDAGIVVAPSNAHAVEYALSAAAGM